MKNWMRIGLAFLCIHLVLPLSHVSAGALSGTIDLSDVGTSVDGVTFPGILFDDRSGVSVSNAGDINGDGIDDLLIGAYRAQPNGAFDAGETYLVYGKSGASALSGTFDLANADVTFNGIDQGDRSGFSVSNAGDINDDGIDDLLIGAKRADGNGIASAGETYLVYGKSGASALSGTFDLANADATFTGVNPIDLSGWSVSNAGDINGDGIDDLLIGAYRAEVGTGKTYLVYGKSGASALAGTIDLANADVTFKGIDGDDASGSSVSNAGDINGDGIDDLLIGASSADPNGIFGAGETYLVYGKSGASALSGTFDLANADVTFNGIGSSDQSGSSVSNAGDINGDGIDDLLIGASDADPTNEIREAGETYLIYGKSGASALSGAFDLANADVTFNGIGSSDFSGISVSNAGDINGDGIDDLLIGAVGGDPNGGEIYLVYGKSGASALAGAFDLANADVIFNGVHAQSESGISVSNAGDINGDGIDDLLIGAFGTDPNGDLDAGETYLVYGQIPEPGTLALLGLGISGLTLLRRRRNCSSLF